jgi:hypothetical protein
MSPRPERMEGACADLNDAFQRIRRRVGENELLRLLIEMLEAGDIELCKERSGDEVRYWLAAKDTCFARRFLEMENDIRAEIAEGFLTGIYVFSVDIGEPLDVRWEIRRRPVN